jgi:hypothetical protein
MVRRSLANWLLLFFVAVPLARPFAAPATRPASARPSGPDRRGEDLWSPANPTSGGLVFLVNPSDASIYVDGSYAGRPLNFSPERPLRLEAGPHRIELIATGYATVRADVSVVAGFVTPMEAVMEKW